MVISYVHRKIIGSPGAMANSVYDELEGPRFNLPNTELLGENLLESGNEKIYYEILSQGNNIFVKVIGYVDKYKEDNKYQVISQVRIIPIEEQKGIEELIEKDLSRKLPISFYSE